MTALPNDIMRIIFSINMDRAENESDIMALLKMSCINKLWHQYIINLIIDSNWAFIIPNKKVVIGKMKKVSTSIETFSYMTLHSDLLAYEYYKKDVFDDRPSSKLLIAAMKIAVVRRNVEKFKGMSFWASDGDLISVCLKCHKPRDILFIWNNIVRKVEIMMVFYKFLFTSRDVKYLFKKFSEVLPCDEFIQAIMRYELLPRKKYTMNYDVYSTIVTHLDLSIIHREQLKELIPK